VRRESSTFAKGDDHEKEATIKQRKTSRRRAWRERTSQAASFAALSLKRPESKKKTWEVRGSRKKESGPKGGDN